MVGLACRPDPGGRGLEQLSAHAEETREHLTWLIEGSGCAEAPIWADRLIHEFGSIGAMLAASPSRQARALSENEAIVKQIGMFKAAMLHVLRSTMSDRPLLPGSKQVHDYLKASLAWQTKEQFRALFLDAGNRLIRDELIAQGTVDRAQIYDRELFGRAIELGAAGMILVHNHPGGDPMPSVADGALTLRLVSLARQLDIDVLDHLIVATGGVTSMRQLGWLDCRRGGPAPCPG